MPAKSQWIGLVCTLFAAAFNLAAQSPEAAGKTSLRQADAAFHEGFAAQQSGDLELARAKYARVVELAPRIAEGHEALGAVLIELNRAKEAIPELETAVRLSPGNGGAESNLALAYVQAGDPAKAIGHFAAAVKAATAPGKPKMNAAFFDAYGHALAAVGRPAEAIPELLAEEEQTGPRADLEDALGSLEAQLGRWSEARPRFERAIALDGSLVSARVHLGVLFRQQNDLPDSLTALGAATEAHPTDPQAAVEFGRTLAAAGRDDEAARQFERALAADPGLAGAALDLAMALQRLGRQEEAIPWFEKAVRADPENASAETNLGLALTLTGKAKEGEKSLERAQRLDAGNPVVWKDMGVAHVQLSAFDEAISDFQKALALDPNDPQLHYDLGLAFKFKDRYDDAITELRKAEEMDPDLRDPPYTLGILLMQLGKLDDAVLELKKAVALEPQNGDGWAILGSTLKQAARLPEAADALRKAIPLLPGQPGPRVTLAGVLAEEAGNAATEADAAESAGDASKAWELRTQMTELRGEAAALRKEGADLARGAVSRQQANFALNAGNQLMLRGEVSQAIARYQESIAADPTFATPHQQLAIAYERQGRSQDADAERARARQLGAAPGPGQN